MPFARPFYALAVLVTVTSLATPAQAFNSFPNGDLHRRLTEAAGKSYGVPPAGIETMCRENYRQDFNEVSLNLLPGKGLVVPNGNYNPADHFDRNAGEDNATAFSRGVSQLSAYRARAIAAFRKGLRQEHYAWLGRASHGLQDFFSHSNYVDLSAADQATCLEILGGRRPSSGMPAGLRLTGYDRRTGRDIPGDSYGHDAKSKDGPHKNAEALALIGGRTKYELAYEAALEATRQMLQDVRGELGPSATFNHGN